jgi:hypothetical protein
MRINGIWINGRTVEGIATLDLKLDDSMNLNAEHIEPNHHSKGFLGHNEKYALQPFD